MKRGGFSVSVPQRRKAADEGKCRVCLRPGPDPAHVVPRSLGGCADPLCVVPLCRSCHRMYDHERRLDVLPYLSVAEQAHAVGHLGLARAFMRVTNDREVAA